MGDCSGLELDFSYLFPISRHRDFLISSATVVIGKAGSLLSGLTLAVGSVQLSGVLEHIYYLMQRVNRSNTRILFPRKKMACVCVYKYMYMCV